MRTFLFSLSFAVAALLFLAPRDAQASEAFEAPFHAALREAREAASAPFDSPFGLAQGERVDHAPFGLTPGERTRTESGLPAPRGPVEDPADWIAVVGIACYAIIPVVLVVVLGFVAYEVWMHQTDAALLSGTPRGLVLLRFR